MHGVHHMSREMNDKFAWFQGAGAWLAASIPQRREGWARMGARYRTRANLPGDFYALSVTDSLKGVA